jgi:large subunit ribosomal protein L10
VAITKDKKKDILTKLEKILSDAKGVAFVNFSGLTVAGATELRRTLKAAEVGYFVAKKTLIRKALSGKKVDGEIPELAGEVGMAYSAEPTAPAREAHAFAKKLEKGLKLVGGIFEGKYMDEKSITSIALIPSRKTLEAQFVNLINSPIQRFVVALNEVAKKKA